MTVIHRSFTVKNDLIKPKFYDNLSNWLYQRYIKAGDPARMMEEMVSALREAWGEKYPEKGKYS